MKAPEKPIKLVKISTVGKTSSVEADILFKFDDKHRPNDKTKSNKDYLKHVPDPECYRIVQSYNIKYPSLIDLGNMDPDQTLEERSQRHGPYFMWRQTSEADTAKNENKSCSAFKDKATMFGDVYIFKVKEPAFDAEGNVGYDDLDDDFVETAFKGKGIEALESLRWLAEQ